jgi:hypothetical protein
MPNTFTGPKLQLPGGGQLQGFPALAAQTAACSATTNLLTQVAPLLALMQCQNQVVNLLKPLIDVVKALPNPPAHAVLGSFRKFIACAPGIVSGGNSRPGPSCTSRISDW